ncbi:M20 family metallopeptidase [Sutterella sp.]|uniref:M20 metallopeptidase family protein n=1 Tax=Sutterella sp. TaxID=1981025 RepID=UPI0026E01278|nr:amidohydrolase [Sutterella sp.]MDO5530930.1 amidohydrolase [Sutterella sp.]
MTSTLEELLGAEDAARLVAFRRDLHRHPEIGMDTVRTAQKIEEFLATFPVDRVERVEKNGVVAVINGRAAGPMIGLRGDIDALPVKEETGVEWTSCEEKRAHLCGHDGHAAGIMATALYLSKHRDFAGSVALIFQPGEEGFAGADLMIKDGLFEKFPCREVFAIHGDPQNPLGDIAIRDGAMTASVDIAYMTVEGRGGHGARPHETIDPVPAAAQLILALQTIVSRTINPAESAVVSCCFVHAGDPVATTVIPQRVELSATIRTLNPAVRDQIEKRFEEICAGVAAQFGGQIRLDYQRRYPPQINDAELTRATIPALEAAFGAEHVRTKQLPMMGGEDFAFMSEKVPGVYMRLGLRDENHTAGLHNPGFDYNDLALGSAVTAFASIVRARLPL